MESTPPRTASDSSLIAIDSTPVTRSMGSMLSRTASVPTTLGATPVRCGPSVPAAHRITDDRILCKAVHRWDDSLYPEYTTWDARIKSFSNWPPRIAPSAEALSDAGFFYRGNICSLVLQTHSHCTLNDLSLL